MTRGRPEGQDESRGRLLAEGVHYVVLKRALAVRAVDALADDDQNPSLARPLTLLDEAMHLSFRLGSTVTMQIALRFDLKP